MPRTKTARNILERLIPPEDIAVPTLTLAGVGALSAALIFGGNWQALGEGDGNGRDSQAYIAGLDPAQRFQHDYAGYDESGDDCLEPTGYDLFDAGHNQVVKVGRVSIQGDVLTIIPGEPNKHAEPIELLLDDGPNKGVRPLQPANTESAEILAAHGCVTRGY